MLGSYMYTVQSRKGGRFFTRYSACTTPPHRGIRVKYSWGNETDIYIYMCILPVVYIVCFDPYCVLIHNSFSNSLFMMK